MDNSSSGLLTGAKAGAKQITLLHLRVMSSVSILSVRKNWILCLCETSSQGAVGSELRGTITFYQDFFFFFFFFNVDLP